MNVDMIFGDEIEVGMTIIHAAVDGLELEWTVTRVRMLPSVATRVILRRNGVLTNAILNNDQVVRIVRP